MSTSSTRQTTAKVWSVVRTESNGCQSYSHLCTIDQPSDSYVPETERLRIYNTLCGIRRQAAGHDGRGTLNESAFRLATEETLKVLNTEEAGTPARIVVLPCTGDPPSRNGDICRVSIPDTLSDTDPDHQGSVPGYKSLGGTEYSLPPKSKKDSSVATEALPATPIPQLRNPASGTTAPSRAPHPYDAKFPDLKR